MARDVWDHRNPHEWLDRVGKSQLPPLIVCCAVNGGVHGKEANPNLPETPEELAESTEGAYRAGASMVHVHVRDPEKLYDSSGSAEEYRRVNRMIRERCPGIIINNTTGGSYGMSDEERLACLDAGPEMASLNLGPEMYKMKLRAREAPLPHPRPAQDLDGIYPTTYRQISKFARAMKDRGIKPELELYHPGMFWVLQDLLAQKLLSPPHLVQLVLGTQTGSYPTPWNLLALIQELPPESLFEVIGIGSYQLPMNTMAILLGGHVRVGMEDNVYYRRGQLLESNAQAVERVVRIARELNRNVATPAEAREMLGLAAQPNRP